MFGMEMEYMYPNNSATENEADRIEQVSNALDRAGIWNEVYLSKIESKQTSSSSMIDTWKVVSENDGSELVSPVRPSMDTIHGVIRAMQDLHVGIRHGESQLSIRQSIKYEQFTRIL